MAKKIFDVMCYRFSQTNYDLLPRCDKNIRLINFYLSKTECFEKAPVRAWHLVMAPRHPYLGVVTCIYVSNMFHHWGILMATTNVLLSTFSSYALLP